MMKFLTLVPLLVLSCAAQNPFLCSSNCGLGSGEDVCSHGGVGGGGGGNRCQPLVVRPQELPRPPLPSAGGALAAAAAAAAAVIPSVASAILPLKPMGSPCSCQSPIVKPAVIPRPNCAAFGRNTVTNTITTNQQQLQQQYFGCHGPHAITSATTLPIMVDQVRAPSNPAQYFPADAVSMAIAYKMAQEACHHSEDKLSFGFRTLPKEVPQVRKQVNNIPEEKLYKLNGQIVELKPVQCSSGQLSVDEEAVEELLNLSEEEKVAPEEVRRISMGDIGYGPAKIKSATFVDVPLANPIEAVVDALGNAVGKAASCNDGFRPGAVEIRQIPRIESLALPVPLPEPCDSGEEGFLPPAPVLPPQCNCGPIHTFHQSSSSSCNHKATQNVLLQKLWCN